MCLSIEWEDVCLSIEWGGMCLSTEWGMLAYLLTRACVVCALDPEIHPLNLHIETRNNVIVGSFMSPTQKFPITSLTALWPHLEVGSKEVTESVKCSHR